MTYLNDELAIRFPYISLKFIATRPSSPFTAKLLGSTVGILRVLRACASRSVDLVHVNVAPRGSTFRKLLCARIARYCGVPAILHLHGSGYDDFFDLLPRWLQQTIRSEFQKATAVIVLGEHWRRFVASELQVSPERLFVVSNGVPRTSSAETRGSRPPRVLCLGQLGYRKGTDVLLHALAQLPADLEWRATIAGDGELKRFSQIAEELGLSSKVEFPGWVNGTDVSRLLAGADVFALPSRAENQPLSIIEAMASGLPVVATRVGSIPEQVEHGQTGYLVTPGDVGETAAALEHLLRSEQLRREYGANGSRAFESRFSSAAMTTKIVSIYHAARTQSFEAA